jgi:hypothetical protein
MNKQSQLRGFVSETAMNPYYGECVHSHQPFHKGQIIRVWDGLPFHDEYNQASYMIQHKKARKKPLREDTRSPYDHYMFKGQEVIHFQGMVFCDLEEFAQYLAEYGIGILEVVGEQVVAL